MKHFVLHTILFLMIVTVAGCQDDFLTQETIGEGKANVSATLDFKPMSSALAQTRAAGDALKEINSLYVLLYDEEKKLIEQWTRTDLKDYVESDESRNDTDAENGDKAEEQTKHATFKLPKEIGYGRYYMYAVANIPDLLRDNAEAIKTVEGLKSIQLTWNSDNITANGQMMGYFTNASSSSSDTELLEVKEKSVKLRAWLRRAASKITVAFDASKLNDGIRIHFKSIKIKHIPKTCYLGHDNAPGYKSADNFVENNKNQKTIDDELHENGEVYYYNGKPDDPDENFASWPFVSRGKHYYGLLPSDTPAPESPININVYHTEKTPALYFYENLQGNEQSRPDVKDKRQDATGPDGTGEPDGNLDAPGLPGDPNKYPYYKLKDNVEFGTYIEVEGYYDARLSDRPGEGKIIYRFMLGQDVEKDYNAKRNCHYKLTLKFNGYANDVDWHIEYREDKELIVPSPYYISYLYNQAASIPIKIKGSNLDNVKLEVRIIENHWWPTVEEGDDFTFADLSKVYPEGKQSEAVWHGFLSLAYDSRKIIGDGKHYETDKDWNKKEWDNIPANGSRTFDDLTVGEHSGYSVEVAHGGGLNLRMPFYTRPKQMIPLSGYTGNNPYVAYPREAKIELKLRNKLTNEVLKDTHGKNLIDTVSIIQVRRCVNPKGVWRSWDKKESFHVVMKILPNESANKFETYNSKGPWRAKVEIDQNNMIKLKDADPDGYVHGTIDSPMDFWIDFNGICNDANTVRSAIVLVEYNNYTCNHRIFVRQGYAPLTLNDKNIKWHSFNLYSKNEETQSPLEEGSLFKYGNLDDAILAENNKMYGFQQKVGDNPLKLADNKSKKWSDIQVIGTKEVDTSAGFSDKNIQVSNPNGTKVKVRVATVGDYDNLRNGENREFGYGVLYGDGATETLEKIDEVYGYYRDGDKSYGMRGCFVYNKINGNNLFFPIGASGYGKRRTEKSWYKSGIYLPGALQYAWRSKRYSMYTENYDKNGWEQLKYRPLFEDVYMRPGAVYWCERFMNFQLNGETKKSSHAHLDINYFTFDFSLSGNEPLEGETSSACFIRCVEDVK